MKNKMIVKLKENKVKSIMKQSKSKSVFIREGKDWGGVKFSNKLIETCLELEERINENPELLITDSWSDFQPSYQVLGLRKTPLKIKDRGLMNTHYNIIEVFPRVIGKEGYYIRDYRENSPYHGQIFSEKFFSLDELIEEINREDRGMCITERLNN